MDYIAPGQRPTTGALHHQPRLLPFSVKMQSEAGAAAAAAAAVVVVAAAVVLVLVLVVAAAAAVGAVAVGAAALSVPYGVSSAAATDFPLTHLANS